MRAASIDVGEELIEVQIGACKPACGAVTHPLVKQSQNRQRQVELLQVERASAAVDGDVNGDIAEVEYGNASTSLFASETLIGPSAPATDASTPLSGPPMVSDNAWSPGKPSSMGPAVIGPMLITGDSCNAMQARVHGFRIIVPADGGVGLP